MIELGDAEKKEPQRREVIRLTTSAWKDKNGVHLRKSLTRLKRKSSGYELLYEDASTMDALEVIQRITNLNSCDDGVYEVVICNESKDGETGCVDDYDYKLIPYKP